jgi:hypothetical protein
MEIIIGCVLGTLFSAGFVALLHQSRNQKEAILEEEEAEEVWKSQQIPLEKKLRDAIYDCERQLKQCTQEIDTACKQQLDLIKDVGKVSYMEIKNKALFFKYHNPISNEQQFYYTKDIHKNLAPDILERTRQLAEQYQQHIDLLSTQQEIFKQLLHTHQENLARLSGITEQQGQLGKINSHQEKLAHLKGEQQLEEKAIYGELLLKDIAEELDHQEECMRQYMELSDTYQRPLNQVLDENYQQKLEQLLAQLELEDPSQPD